MQLTAAIIHDLKRDRRSRVVVWGGDRAIKAILSSEAQAELDELWLTDLKKYGNRSRPLIGLMSGVLRVGPGEVFLTYQFVV